MIIWKHVGHKIKNSSELENLLSHLKETTSEVEGVSLKDICFPKGKDEFILVLECISEDRYLEWREICPPPSGASDWYEILLTKDEQFPDN
jgi:hypothetical protein